MSKLRLSVQYSFDYDRVDFAVRDGDDKIVATESFRVSDLPEDNFKHTHAYGVNKVLTDRNSGIKDDPAAKLAAMTETWELLLTGEWAKERVVGAIEVSVFVEALAQITDQSIPDTQAGLGQYTKEVRAQILERDDVQELGKEIAKARGTRKVDNLDAYVPKS